MMPSIEMEKNQAIRIKSNRIRGASMLAPKALPTLPHSGAKSTSAPGHSGGSGAGQGYPQVLCGLQGCCCCCLHYGRLFCLSAMCRYSNKKAPHESRHLTYSRDCCALLCAMLCPLEGSSDTGSFRYTSVSPSRVPLYPRTTLHKYVLSSLPLDVPAILAVRSELPNWCPRSCRQCCGPPAVSKINLPPPSPPLQGAAKVQAARCKGHFIILSPSPTPTHTLSPTEPPAGLTGD